MIPRAHRGGVVALLLMLCGCSALPPPEQPEPSRAAAELPPAGFGTLRQDQFTLELRDGAVLLRATPLEEEVIRLAAPDTYRRLTGLAEQQRAALRERPLPGVGSGSPVLLLVSFFSREGGAAFEPSEVAIESGGQLLRPLRVEGLTPGWGEQRLRAQEPQSAIYVFGSALDLGQPFVLRYGTRSTEGWREILPLLREENSRARARAAAG
ncbi:MAG TPA: hypothetical protein VGR27_13015 [Longimicrobiaceae bacterium]|nr:hypothetical protein [Longimicrobiaceae bacterium]